MRHGVREFDFIAWTFLRNVCLHENPMDGIPYLVGNICIESRLGDPDCVEPVQHAVDRFGHAE